MTDTACVIVNLRLTTKMNIIYPHNGIIPLHESKGTKDSLNLFPILLSLIPLVIIGNIAFFSYNERDLLLVLPINISIVQQDI